MARRVQIDFLYETLDDNNDGVLQRDEFVDLADSLNFHYSRVRTQVTPSPSPSPSPSASASPSPLTLTLTLTLALAPPSHLPVLACAHAVVGGT
jgi:hypothetical protein